MIEPKIPANEKERLQDLYHYEILDTDVEEEFDMLVELASRICDTPISTITLIDSDRQWFKAKMGVEITETSRNVSFCGHAILQNDLFVINDATQDIRFADNPLVVGDPSIRFYAGAQIRSAGGHKLGTLCVIDSKPKELGWHQASALRTLATQASRLLELRYLKTRMRTAAPEKEVLRRQNAVGELTAKQAAFFTATEEVLLEPLKTGRFTKKELTAIYLQSKALLEANKRFANILSLYNQDKSDGATAEETLDLFDWLSSTCESLNTSQEKKVSRPQITVLPKETKLHNKNSEKDILKQLLGIVLLDFSAQVKIEGVLQEEKLVLRIYLPNMELEGYSSPMDWENSQVKPTSELGAYSLRLISWVVADRGGSLEVHNDLKGGSHLFVTLPTGR